VGPKWWFFPADTWPNVWLISLVTFLSQQRKSARRANPGKDQAMPIDRSRSRKTAQQVRNEMDPRCVQRVQPGHREALDRSTASTRTTGELIAQGEFRPPVFVGTMQFTVQAIERKKR
jgi:hypothetical protein